MTEALSKMLRWAESNTALKNLINLELLSQLGRFREKIKIKEEISHELHYIRVI